MKYFISIFLFLFVALFYSQQGIYVQGTSISMPYGSSLFVNGDVVNDADVNGTTVNSRILNTGTIFVTGNIINNSNDNLFWNDSLGKVVLVGSAVQNLSGPRLNFYSIETNNTSGVILQDDIIVQDSISLVSGGLNLNGYNIYLNDSIGTGVLSGESNSKRIFGSSGQIVCKDRFLNGGGNIGGLGIELDANTVGLSELRRGHTSISSAGDGSIDRYYTIRPSFTDTVSITFNYLDVETAGLNEIDFQIFKSIDSAIWRQSDGMPLAGLNQILNANVVFDTLNVLTVTESNCDNPPLINFMEDTLYRCGSDSVLIDPQLSDNYEFRWGNLATDSAIYVQSAGNYLVEVIDSSGCFSLDSVRVIDASFPIASVAIAPALLTCQGSVTQFDGSSSSGGIINYIWDYLGDNSITDTTQSSLSSHVYSSGGDFYARLTVETSEGCLDSATVTVQIDSLPNVSFSFNDVCADSTAVFSNASFGQGVFSAVSSVLWDFGNGNTSTNFNPLTQVYSPDGTYAVKLIVTEDSGCKDSLSQTITVHPNPLASFTQSTICEGEATVFTNASTSAANYNWTFGDGNFSTLSNPSHIYADDGLYAVTLLATSSFGCTNEVVNSITVNKKPIASFSFVDICQYDTVVFNNTTVDAITPVFNWSFGDATASGLADPTKHYLSSGNYPVQLKVTSSNGCVDSVVQTVSIFEVPVSQFTINDNCADSIVSLTNLSSIATGFITDYLWDFQDGQTDVNQLPNINYLNAGLFAPTLVVTSNNGCLDTTSQNITIHANPVFTFLDTISTCGVSMNLNAENVGSTYLWTTAEITQTISVSVDGDYGVEVTTPFGCHDEDSVYALLNVLVNPNLGNDTTVCDSLIIDGYSPGSIYLWSTAEVDSAIVVINSGTYYLDRIDQNLCNGTDTIVVTVNVSPAVSLGGTQVICDDDNVVFDAGNTGLDFLWNTAEITQQITADTSGFYEVIVTDLSTGCNGVDTVELVVNPLPVLSLGNDTIVCDSIILFPGVYNSVIWSNGLSTDSIVATVTSQYYIDVTNTFGCEATDSVSVTVFTSPALELGLDTVLCQNQILNLTGASVGVHTWSDASAMNNYLVTSPGVIYVDVIDGICMATDTITVEYDSVWTIDLGLDAGACVGLSVDLLPNYTVGLSFDWFQGSTYIASGNQLSVNQSSEYEVVATNSYGCISKDTLSFTSYPFPIVSDFLMASDASPGDTVQFIPVTIDSNLTYFWSFGNGATSNDTLAAYRYVLMGDYDVELTVSNGFCSDSLIKTITISPSKNVFGFDAALYQNTESTISDAIVYPNPSNGNFNLAILLSEEKYVDAYFTDLQGKLIYSQRLSDKLEQNYSFDLESSLNSGIYLLVLQSGIEHKVIKVIVNN